MVGLDGRLRSLLGDKTAKPMAATLDLHTAGDLLRHYPRRYAQRGELTGFRELQVGEFATVFAEVTKVKGRKLKPKLFKTDVTVADDDGNTMTMAIFNRPWVEKDLRAGRRAFFAGKVEVFNRKVQLANPEYQLVDDDEGVVSEEFAGALIPIYPATSKVGSIAIARSVRQLLDIVDFGPDPLPAEIRQARGLLGLEAALRAVHRPDAWADVARARDRLKWDEAFVLQVTLAQRRLAARSLPGVPRSARPGGLLERFDRSLPFALTAGQQEIGTVLARELAQPHPMHRLLQGEVGSGKTLVALRAMLAVVDSGGQAALLAPTEVLAQQHHRSIRDLLGPLGQHGELGGADVATRVALLTGSQGAASRRTALAETASGAAGIVVGTHALLSEDVQFADLGLVVVDEQHRFGVAQRAALGLKSHVAPDMLVMSATPIPRTLTMALFGDLDLSKIDELPPGRSPIITRQKGPHQRQSVYEGVEQLLARGRQAYIVCPNIEGSEKMQTQAAVDLHYRLANDIFPHRRIGLLHGQLKSVEKEQVMAQFRAGELDVLVCTVVIEVGVDVPNATVMVIEDAHRFGLSQLHQLRGRVGRGSHQSFCILISDTRSEDSKARIDTLVQTTDGFQIAEADLDLRGPGEVIGTQQHGQLALHVADLVADVRVLEEARDAAIEIVRRDPRLEDSSCDRIRPLVLERKGEKLLRGMN